MATLKSIVQEWLAANGYDGLMLKQSGCVRSCSCKASDLFETCARGCSICEPCCIIDCMGCEDSESCARKHGDGVAAVDIGHCKKATLRTTDDATLYRRTVANGGRGYAFVPIADGCPQEPIEQR